MQSQQTTPQHNNDFSNPKRSYRRWSFRLLAVGFSFGIGLGFLEGALRLFWQPDATRTISSFDFRTCLKPDRELGYVPKPNVLVEYPAFGATFQTNAAGLRGPDIAKSRIENKRRILVLGDSFAWGHGVSDGRAFPELIDAAMPDSEVVNLGVPGYDLRKERIFYERLGQQYSPDVVVVAICQNDIRDVEGEHRTIKNASNSAMVVERNKQDAGFIRNLKSWLMSSSYSYQYLQQIINSNKSVAEFAVSIGIKEELGGFAFLDDNLRPSLREIPPQMNRAWDQFENDLGELKEAIESSGATLLVALIPCRQAVEPDELTKSIAYTKFKAGDFDLDGSLRRIETVAAAINVAVLNPLDEFRSETARGSSLYLRGDLHFSEEGHRLFADVITARLQSLKVRDNPDSSSLARSKSSRLRQFRLP